MKSHRCSVCWPWYRITFPPADRNNAKRQHFKVSVRCYRLEVTDNVQQVAGCRFDLRSPFSLNILETRGGMFRSLSPSGAVAALWWSSSGWITATWRGGGGGGGWVWGWVWFRLPAWEWVLNSVQVQAVSLCTPFLSRILYLSSYWTAIYMYR